MAFVNHFYNGSTRKYVAIFGSLFNKISITREDNEGDEIQRMTVPISYGPWQKFLSRIKQDPDLNKKSAISLPRMSFEITSVSYDGMRKLPSTQRMRKRLPEADSANPYVWTAAPYNIDFSLNIMTKYSEDATKIVEQILPFFKPEWTVTAKLIEGLDPIDIPIILTGVSTDDVYEGDYETRRTVLWTLNFTMKGWFFGPERSRKLIKFVDVSLHTDTAHDAPVQSRIEVLPGLTASGQPTTNIDESIDYQLIEADDDWGLIVMIEEYERDDE